MVVIKRKKLLASIAVASILTGSGYEIKRLSSDPTGEKNCPPLFLEYSSPLQATETNNVQISLPMESTLNWKQKGGNINDVSCLDQTPIYGILQPRNTKEINDAITFAKDRKLKVSMAGVKHSMGGQAFYKNNLVLDMTKFNQMKLDGENKILTVDSGATWHDIQKFLHPRFAVKSMQSTDIFTVGGSISVNAHGMDHHSGSVGSSIRAMRIMKADGNLEEISPAKNSKLFNLVVGGYGLFGVILDVDLEVVDNDIYETKRQIIKYQDFPKVFDSQILPDPNLGLFYGHLSTSSSSLLKEMILYKYTKKDLGVVTIPPLEEVSSVKLRRLVFNFSKKGRLPMDIKWFMEKNIEPRLETCSLVPRTEAMSDGESCFVSRNEPMHDSVVYTKNNLKGETDILHEYFIPKDNFVAFTDGMRDIITNNKVNLLNASVRVIHPEKNTLNYAPAEMYSFVLYINQLTTKDGNKKMEAVTRELIDLATKLNGTFFLPYQLHYTPEQLEKSYPNIGLFFKSKKVHDPEGMFTNTFYEKYSKSFI